MACLSKPVACAGCSLETKGEGFAPAEGPEAAPLLFVGEALGKVEALTGRPFCLEENTRVLCADLVWRPIRDLHVGDRLFACDEESPGRGISGGRLTRRFRLATVLQTTHREAECFAVQTPVGTLLATAEHRLLTIKNGGSLEGRLRWLRVDQLQGAGLTGKRGSRLTFIGKPWQRLESWEAGWLSGFFDGEGHIAGSRALGRTWRGRQKAGRVGFSQNVGPVTERALGLLHQHGFSTRAAEKSRRNGIVCERHNIAGSVLESIRLLGLVRPLRLLNNLQGILATCLFPLSGVTHPRVESRESVGIRRVVDITTTTGTFIAEGFIVHNCGDAGGMLSRLFSLLGWQRDWVRIHNVINCKPPNDWFDERAPWYYSAINHCRYLDTTLAEPHKVIVTLGATALKRVLGLVGHKKIQVKDFHGTLNLLPSGQIVVPTFHPSFLQRGAHNLIGTVLWDLQQAEAALTAGKPQDAAQIICDPPLEWFRAWVDQVVAARTQDREAYPISSDVETPDKAGGKDEGEMTADDRSFQILRQNVSCHPDEGITVPQVGPYIDELQRLYASPGPIWEWNREYDFQRQVAARQLREEDSSRVVDLMWLWHMLQSDLPRGLGFVAPFYSGFGPWKHLSVGDPVRYAAIDALQTHRIGFGLTADLHKLGMYDVAMRHTHVLHTAVLRPAQLLGVKIDRSRLMIFKEALIGKARRSIDEIQEVVPQELQPLTPKAGLTKKPLATVLHAKASAFTRAGKPRAGKPVAEIKQELYARAELVEKLLLKEVLVCRLCAAVGVQRRHRCKPEALAQVAARTTVDRGALPQIELDVATVTRWFWKEPFNPDSPKQVLDYILWKKHQPGKHKKTKLDTTDRETLERLERQTKDPFYRSLLDYRAVNKVKGTYVEGTERRLDEHDRLHPKPTFKPSTMRLSYQDPNITNVVADKGGKAGLAAGFRQCVVAGTEKPAWLTQEDCVRWVNKWGVHLPDNKLFECKLLEVDFSAIEAVLTGYFAHDPEYMRLATLGVHAALSSHVMGRPYDPTWTNAKLSEYFAEIKEHHGNVYDPAKRFIHGRNYGLTRHGMMRQFPQFFPTETAAKRYEVVFEKMAPKIPAWQKTTQMIAARQHYLGGESHPFKYKHWFWSVYTYRRLNTTQYYKILAKCRQDGTEPPVLEMNGQYFRMAEGEDAKRALAFLPQGTAAGVLKETLLRLLADPSHPSYIGDAYFGRTPLRAPIHDSGLFEIPLVLWDRILPIIIQAFRRPIPELPLDPTWNLGEYLSIGVAAKAGYDWQAMEKVQLGGFDEPALAEPVEDEDNDDFLDLARHVS